MLVHVNMIIVCMFQHFLFHLWIENIKNIYLIYEDKLCFNLFIAEAFWL